MPEENHPAAAVAIANYDKPAIESPTEQDIEEWNESEEAEEQTTDRPSRISLEEKYSESQLRIVRSSLDLPIHTLQHSLKDSEYIKLKPEYQRRLRWDRKRRSQLIESFLMNIPVPPLYLFESSYNHYEVMDGRQRLETIRDFLEGAFALTGMEFWTELNTKRYAELPPTLQRGFLRRSIQAIVLLAETSRPDENIDVRMVLFRRLNTGGAHLNPQELRNALYPGKFNEMLADIARSDLFTRVWRIPAKTPDEKERVPHSLENNSLFRTMADCELVLRFFTIKETVEGNLKGAIKLLLDNCMARHATDDNSAVDRHTALFERCLGTLDGVFEGKPFVLPSTNRPSRPLYDALMVACSLNFNENFAANGVEIRSRLAACLDDPATYEILVGRGNTVETIRERVRKAGEILRG